MSKTMQNLVVLMEPSQDACDVSLKGGNMILNRFCIDEDAAFELSGADYAYSWDGVKGIEYSFLWSYFISRNLIFMNK